MLKLFSLCFFLLLLLLLLDNAAGDSTTFANITGVWPQPDIWPLPQSFVVGFSMVQVVPSMFKFVVLSQPKSPMIQSVLNDAITRAVITLGSNLTSDNAFVSNIFYTKIFPNQAYPVPVANLTAININVVAGDDLSFGVDESYNLTIPASGVASLNAQTVWGALHGLESFVQLCVYQPLQPPPTSAYGYAISNVPMTVNDAPRFGWRGLLVDVSRHYLSVSFLQHIIDAMAMNKLNVLHLHLTDAESFPFQSYQYPNMTLGAYTPNAVYQPFALSLITQYAHQRGVRVVPEIDTPGHTASWEFAYPGINVDCWNHLSAAYSGYMRWPAWDSVGLDISGDSALPLGLTQGLLREISTVFTDQYMHVGGDEVIASCYLQDARILNALNQTGQPLTAAGVAYLQSLWEANVTSYVTNVVNRTAVVWEEAFLATQQPGAPQLPQSTVVNTWQFPSSTQAAVQAGYNVISNIGWYLDRQVPTCLTSPTCATNYLWMYTWHDMYGFDPVTSVTGWFPTPQQLQQILGGEMSAFGESISEDNFDARVWSRGVAVTERLWSPQNITSITRAQERNARFICKMQQRGFTAAPAQPGMCVAPTYSSCPSAPPLSNSYSPLLISSVVLAVSFVVTLIGGIMGITHYRNLALGKDGLLHTARPAALNVN